MARPTAPIRDRRSRLTWGQRLDLELSVPPPEMTGYAPAFDSEDERRAAWEAHRAELVGVSPPGERPAAFWQYDGPVELRDHARLFWLPDDAVAREQRREDLEAHEDRRVAWLATTGQLRPAEVAAIRRAARTSNPTAIRRARAIRDVVKEDDDA